MLNAEEMRFACDDARRRHASLANLILAGDRTAMGFLQFFSTLATALLSAGVAVKFASSPSLPPQLGWVMIAAALPLIIAATLAFAALWGSDFRCEGEEPEFWLWALDAQEESADIQRMFLKRLQESIAINRRVNRRVNRLMSAARASAAASPALAFVTFMALLIF